MSVAAEGGFHPPETVGVGKRADDDATAPPVAKSFRADDLVAALRTKIPGFRHEDAEKGARDILLEAAPLLVAKDVVAVNDDLVRVHPPRPPPNPPH